MYEMGGDSGPLYERASLVAEARSTTYGAMDADLDDVPYSRGEEDIAMEPQGQENALPLPITGDRDGNSSTATGGRGERVDIPTDMLLGMAHDLRQVERDDDDGNDDEIEDDRGFGTGAEVDADDEDKPVVHKYTCPNTGRIAFYHEVPGGGNVLPYVYASPEPYTLVSQRDEVYVLVAPNVSLPDSW